MITQRLKETMINERECTQLCHLIRAMVEGLKCMEGLGVSPQTVSFGAAMMDKLTVELEEGKKYLLEWAAFRKMMEGKK
jgi:hypothetical protein